MVDGDEIESLDFYRDLAKDELQVEILPAPGDRKRPREESEAGLELEPAPAHVPEIEADEDEEEVSIILCDQGPSGGSMSYYLNRGWQRPSGLSGRGALLPAHETSSTAELAHAPPDNRAEVVEQDEGIEETLARIEFHMDGAELAETPWRMRGADLQDFFNFGLDERSWKDYVLRQVRIRLEARQRRKIGVLEGHR